MLLEQQLLDLHTNYEEAEPYGLERVDKPLEQPLPRLKHRKGTDSIEIDSATTLQSIPPEAWSYVLGTRSALEWVLDQYKEKKDDLPPSKASCPITSPTTKKKPSSPYKRSVPSLSRRHA